MAAKKKAVRRPAKGATKTKRKPAARRAAKGRARRPAAKGARAPKKVAKRKASPAARKAKAPGKAAPQAAASPAPVAVTPFSLERVQVPPLRYEAAAALGRLESVQLLAGRSEEGARVETLVFGTGAGVQSSGTYVHRGTWNGTRLLTEKGHLLDVDGSCFCRECETAGGYTVDDDE